MYQEHQHVFIATGFSEESRRRARLLADMLDSFGIHSVFGDSFGGGEVSEGVRARIESAWFVIALLTRGTPVGEHVWEPRHWLIEELAWGKASKKECLILVEEGVALSGGILGDIQYLTFNADDFVAVLPQFIRELNALLNRQHLTLGVNDLPILTHVSNEQIVDECNDEAKFLILKVRHLARQQRYEEALRYAAKATEVDPRSWRAWTTYGALLVQLGKVEDGDRIFAQVLKDFPNHRKAKATAFHNRGWVKEVKAGYNPSPKALLEQAKMYSKALSLDHTRVHSRAALLSIFVELGELEKAHKLLEESVMFEGFLEALRLDLESRGARLHSILQSLPVWVRNLFYPIRRNGSGGSEY